MGFKVEQDLFPVGNNDNWILMFMKDGKSDITLFESKEDVFMELVSLKDLDYDLSKVFVFPPNSSLSFAKFLSP